MARAGRINIREWMGQLRSIGAVTDSFYNDIVKANEEKALFLKKYDLPTNAVYGTIESLQGLEELIPAAQGEQGLYWLRCIPQDSRVKFRSFVDLTYEQLQEHIEGLASVDHCRFQIRDYWHASHSGTIIIDRGRVLSELWVGDHVDQDTITAEESMRASIDTTVGEISFSYSPNTPAPEKQVMLDALRFFTNPITRGGLEGLRVYADYIFRKGKGYAFLDGSERPFWTNTGMKRENQFL